MLASMFLYLWDHTWSFGWEDSSLLERFVGLCFKERLAAPLNLARIAESRLFRNIQLHSLLPKNICSHVFYSIVTYSRRSVSER